MNDPSIITALQALEERVRELEQDSPVHQDRMEARAAAEEYLASNDKLRASTVKKAEQTDAPRMEEWEKYVGG